MKEEKLIEILQKIQAGKVGSEDLIGKNKELVIIHDSSEYRLRITSNNKLILTK
jgi:hemin uptake protein HemP